MSGCFTNASCISPYKMNTSIAHEHHSPNPLEKQGIVSIFSSDFSKNTQKISSPNSNHSIRRTLSADMSSQKWLQTNGFPPSTIMRVQSSEHLQALGKDDHENEMHSDNHEVAGGAFEDIWSSIQANKNRSWSSILSHENPNGSGSGQLPPPYVHPLVRRSASSLSEKSLEICTESLGSETGSDVFSGPVSKPEDSDSKDDGEQEEEKGEKNENHVLEEIKGYNNYYTANKMMMKAAPIRSSFPPPLPSLAHRDGSNLHMRVHRLNGRLVVEAIPVPSQNCFRAQRTDGRLLLTLSDHHLQEEIAEAEVDQDGGEEENMVEEDDHEEEPDEEGEDDNVEKEYMAIPKGVINHVHGPSSAASIMSKLMDLTSTRSKSTWPHNFNTTVIKTLEEAKEEEETTPVAQSLPQVPPRVCTATAAAAALNAYEYYWRRADVPTSGAVAMLKPLAGQQNIICGGAALRVGKDTNRNNNNNNNNNNNVNVLVLAPNMGKARVPQQEKVVLLKAAREGGTAGEKAEYLVPLLRGCKEPRRSLLVWEPYCIATS